MNDEEREQAQDLAWASSAADELMVKLGYPVADVVEGDDD